MAKGKKKTVRKKPAVRKKAPTRKKPVARKKATARKKLTPPKKPPHKRLPRRPRKTPGRHFPPFPHALPDPAPWLLAHPNIAAAILWQFRPGSPNNVYIPPTATDKIAWPSWSAQQKQDLSAAYLGCRNWLAQGAHIVAMGAGGLTDTPTNLQSNTANNTNTVLESVDPSYMWKLYIAHVAMSLALETTQSLPWSVTGYGSLALRYLFDSTSIGWSFFTGVFGIGTYAVYVPVKRVDNRPKTAFAPPKWTYPFLVARHLIGSTRLDTIGRVLQWMRVNLWHFLGNDDYGTCDAVWQYRGYPPLSRVVAGTVDANNAGLGKQHWTMGCHGSVGFLNAVLRVVNIPVQPVWVCDHELAYFVTEQLYLDHGDDPYNQNVKNSSQPVLKVLIDAQTYRQRFIKDETVNITDPNSPACGNVGYMALHFPP